MKTPNYLLLIFMSGTISLLSACSTMQNLHNDLANAELQKKQLANGHTAYINTNVTPTMDWNCKEIGTPQSYNWATLRTEGQFHLSGPVGLLTANALNYANQQNLNPNYINLEIPTEKTIEGFNIHPHAQAVAVYYQCERINPQHKIGFQKKESLSFG